MLTAGQAKYTAFKRELAKQAGIVNWIANRPITTSAIGSGVRGLYDVARHGPWGAGGMSRPEESAVGRVQQAEQGDLSDPIAQDQLRQALKDQRSSAADAEHVGAGLGVAGLGASGLLIKNKLVMPSIREGEKGLSTSDQDLEKMYKHLSGKLEGMNATVPDPHVVPGGGLDVGLHVPKGGYHPGFLRNWEAKQTAAPFEQMMHAQAAERGLKLNPEAVRTKAEEMAMSAMNGKGALVLPTGVGPHIAAHEMGHSLFGASRLGKITKAMRIPGYLGAAAGTAMAATADPDSTTSKLSPLIAAAGIAPYLGEEAGASLRGLKIMKETGFSPAQLSTGRRQLGKAFGTYAAGIGLPIIAAPYLIRKVKEYNRNRRAEKGLESPGQLQSRIDSIGA